MQIILSYGFFPLIFCWSFLSYHKQFWDEHLFSIMSVHLFASLLEVELLSLRQCIFSGFLNQSASESPTLALQAHFKPEADVSGKSDPSFPFQLSFTGCCPLLHWPIWIYTLPSHLKAYSAPCLVEMPCVPAYQHLPKPSPSMYPFSSFQS